MDCYLHMRTTSFCNPTEKALSADLRNLLRDSLDDIDSRLRVGTPHTAFARSYDKEFSQCCNYSKGGGEFRLAWLKEHAKGRLVWYVENVHGSRMDIVFISAVSMYMNRELDVEYLDYCRDLRPKEMNLLRMNLNIMLTASELMAQNRFLSIFYYSALRPMRWLAGKTHEFADFGWGARHMGLVLDIC